MDATATVALEPAPRSPYVFAREWHEVRGRVERLLADYVASAQAKAPSARARELWGHVGRGLEGGKRLRPQLVCLAYQAFGGTDRESCAAVGAAFELLHGALVIHDDVIDRDFARRGRPNVAGTYRADGVSRGLVPSEARHLGSSVGVIAGDLLLAAAFRMLERATAEPALRERLTDILHAAVTDAAAGELADVLMARTAEGSLEDVLEMERLKTAVYSFEAPLRAGAILAGAAEREAEAVGRVATRVGVAYQVIDDVLGTFGDERQTGKPATSDLREGKLTVLTASARQDPLVAGYLKDSHVAGPDEIREALHRAGADSRALTLAHSLVTEALDEARLNGLPPLLRSELTRICNHVLHRES